MVEEESQFHKLSSVSTCVLRHLYLCMSMYIHTHRSRARAHILRDIYARRVQTHPFSVHLELRKKMIKNHQNGSHHLSLLNYTFALDCALWPLGWSMRKVTTYFFPSHFFSFLPASGKSLKSPNPSLDGGWWTNSLCCRNPPDLTIGWIDKTESLGEEDKWDDHGCGTWVN